VGIAAIAATHCGVHWAGVRKRTIQPAGTHRLRADLALLVDEQVVGGFQRTRHGGRRIELAVHIADDDNQLAIFIA